MLPANTKFIRQCSPFLDALLERHPGWLISLQESGRLDSTSPPRQTDLDARIEQHGLDAGLRRFRNFEMLRITWREIARLAPVTETLSDLSLLAELCLRAALNGHHERLAEKFGVPRDEQGAPARLAVIAMGKLGGRELNLSSDIDLVFAFSEAGTCDGRHKLSNEQFFTRQVRGAIKALSEINEHGFCFRVDARLRPFGESGPLVCSFGAMEQYYQREGRDWERYALVKARAVAGDLTAGHELLERLKPFVFRRYVDFGVIESLRGMKQMIVSEVRRYIDFGAIEALLEMHDSLRTDAARQEREADVKRGPGGIREIEFLVQAFQLLRGGREPELQTPSLLEALGALKSHGKLPVPLADQLEQDYLFLRQVENAIQALHDRQQHVLPGGEDLQRVHRIMCHAGYADFESTLDAVRKRVCDAFEDCFPRHDPASVEAATSWLNHLPDTSEGAAVSDPLNRFAQATQRLSMSARARKRLDQLMPMVLARLEAQQHPPAVADDVYNLLLTVCRRSAYLALLYQNPPALDRMLGLFGVSDWIAEAVIRHPALLDELIDPALGKMLPDRDEIQASAKRILESHDDPEQALLALNSAKQAFHLRIAVAELEASLSVHEVQLALTAVAEAFVGCCYRLAQSAVRDKHGALPVDELAVIGYGTLGATALGYDSDLDLIFLYEACPEPSRGPKPVDAEMYHTATVRRLLSYLTSATASGRLYEVDTRLRPNGRSGLLVSSLPAFENYQQREAWTWELQALCRGRPVAGSVSAGQSFGKIRHKVLSARRDPDDTRREVLEMRRRMRDAHRNGDPLKHGDGGLVDIEFVTQLGLLLNGHQYPQCLHGTSTAEQLRALCDISWLSHAQFDVLSEALSGLNRARHLQRLCSGRRRIETTTGQASEVCAAILGHANVD